MGDNLLVVNALGPDTRVGVVEDGSLAEYLLERKRDRGIVGNIYKGRVQRVLPGMQAAFVNLGPTVEKAAFLYAGDVKGGGGGASVLAEEVADADRPVGGRRSRAPTQKIEDVLKAGQEVVVQVVKDPIGPKGARVTGYVSLAGRYLVFMPLVDQVGVSRRIAADSERKRVRKAVEAARPDGAGFVVRTAAEGASDEEIADDVDFLVKLWDEIQRRSSQVKAPGLVYTDLDPVLRCIRDRLTDDIKAVVIDSESEYDRVRRFVGAFMSRWLERIQLYEGREAIFDHYGLEASLRQALDRRVALKSGGSLVIDQGEALTSIDINTGSFVGKRDLEETLTANNLEAGAEIARQLRLRNIGGIIVIDFVDMEKESNRRKVFAAFMEALEADRARTNVTKISELGLVEMTRKRTRESLTQLLTQTCPCCDGRGRVKSAVTVAHEILREVRRTGPSLSGDVIEIVCAGPVASVLGSEERTYLDELEKRFHKSVSVNGSSELGPEEYRIEIGGGKVAKTAKPSASTADASPKSARGRRGGRGRKKSTKAAASSSRAAK